mmetsp:Transcript_111261/g.175336  ORF Transcript_111261/g.175336 Transcript_111261/m.175336 type:complete len:136 (-) Transcript_111261:28-435(-)
MRTRRTRKTLLQAKRCSIRPLIRLPTCLKTFKTRRPVKFLKPGKRRTRKSWKTVMQKKLVAEGQKVIEETVWPRLAEKVIASVPTEEATATRDCIELKIGGEETLNERSLVNVSTEPHGTTSCMQGCMVFFRRRQ